jgi:hypothetical protein
LRFRTDDIGVFSGKEDESALAILLSAESDLSDGKLTASASVLITG